MGNGKTIMNSGAAEIWKEAVLAYFETLSRQSMKEVRNPTRYLSKCSGFSSE
jgi:hypothetical protein